eukprot:gnl/TRDRNA2_/TRDRNA2_189300_c0_seq1.p2 gnl/TRDRNA2_/TRDRNA2_189300_c0~~gnl/TRDRNA2_/TRDRNA2_189300_c0_seq1.p2  ORF type:complete len:102 (-),score=29.12 gnl/TRDRNA2_/TRDRNA2_189300_c0_seq1:93-398(-)
MERSAPEVNRGANAFPAGAPSAAPAAGPAAPAAASPWAWLPAGGAPGAAGGTAGHFLGAAASEHPEQTQRDRKALDAILAELRKEVDRLDEDAWMFEKLPF